MPRNRLEILIYCKNGLITQAQFPSKFDLNLYKHLNVWLIQEWCCLWGIRECGMRVFSFQNVIFNWRVTSRACDWQHLLLARTPLPYTCNVHTNRLKSFLTSCSLPSSSRLSDFFSASRADLRSMLQSSPGSYSGKPSNIPRCSGFWNCNNSPRRERWSTISNHTAETCLTYCILYFKITFKGCILYTLAFKLHLSAKLLLTHTHTLMSRLCVRTDASRMIQATFRQLRCWYSCRSTD